MMRCVPASSSVTATSLVALPSTAAVQGRKPTGSLLSENQTFVMAANAKGWAGSAARVLLLKWKRSVSPTAFVGT